MRGVNRSAVLGLLLMSAPACRSAVSRPEPVTQPSAPVVVTIVVDQLAAWVASERFGELPATGGFARLRREGTWVQAMRYEHAVTDTAPGHSALYTGAVPSVSGIFANEVLVDGRAVSVLRDATAHVVTSDGETGRVSSSLVRLKVETLADRLRAEHPDATILSLSLKDRGALFGGGRAPTAALWLDVKENRFVTSSAVMHAWPGWAAGAAESLRVAEASTWELLDPAWVRAHAVTPDAEAGEGDIPGLGTVFPHPLALVAEPALGFRTSPFADEALLSMGLSALDAEHAGRRVTLLALSLSANDYIGHAFGPDSWEAWDELLRLDAALGCFFFALDARFGADGYAVLLTADHGTTPMPEVGRHAYCDAPDPWARACGVAHRVMPEELATRLASKAREVLGAGEWVLGVSDPYVYLSDAAHALDPVRRAALDNLIHDTAMEVPGVARVYDTRTLPASCPPIDDESIDALVCRSFAPGAGDAYIVLEPGSFFDPSLVLGRGTSHGSPYRYDRTVPFLARAPGRIASGRVMGERPWTTFVATAASLLGIAPPHAVTVGASSL